MKQPFTREQKMTIIYALLCVVLCIVILQLWLLTATMNAYLGGDEDVIWPASIASLACFGMTAGALKFLLAIDSMEGN